MARLSAQTMATLEEKGISLEDLEPMDALERLEASESTSPIYLNHAYDALIRLYVDWDKPDQAREFQDRKSSLKNR